jgi:outer membrane protein OmpA-like peptidoglycan-associated protein
MTATTFDDTTTVQGAPRRMVEDAWRTLNRRYAIGAGVLLAALLLLWGLGMGPGASRSEAPGTSPASGAMQGPAGASRDATGGSTAAVPPSPAARASAGGATGATSGSAAGSASGSTTAAGGTSSAAGSNGAGSSAAAARESNGNALASAAGASSGAANGKAASASGSGNGAAASGNGTAAAGTTAATPRALPGAPVARLFFEPDQAWPTGEVGPSLAPVLARLKADPDTKALVSGFHDRRGSAEQNAALAQRRAQVVRRVLIREGIAAERIVLARPQQTQGSGPDREARRVEVTVAR